MEGIKVWTYWEGAMPAYISMCLHSMRRWCPDFTLLTPDNVESYINEDLHRNWKTLTRPAHKADCIRVAVINRYGGLWVDADTVFIRPVSLFEEIIEKQFLYSRWTDGRVLNGYFYGAKNNPINSEWLKKINAILYLKGHNQPDWTAFGEKLLTPLINDPQYSNYIQQISRDVFLPINVDKVPNVFFESISYKTFVSSCTVAVGLNHSYFCDHYNHVIFYDQEQWFKSGTLLGDLLKDSHVGYRLPKFEEVLQIILGEHVNHSINLGDLQILIDYLSGFEKVVELGTFKGKTTRILSYMNQKVITVDVFEKLFLIEDTEESISYCKAYEDNPHPFPVVSHYLKDRDNIEVLQMLTSEAAAMHDDNSIDGVFVDADHSYSGVNKDFNAWLPKMKKGGRILFHDVNGAHKGVLQFYNELINNNTVKEITPLRSQFYSSIKIFEKV